MYILRFTLPVGVESFSVYLFGTEQVNHSCCYCCVCERPTPLACAHHSEVGFLGMRTWVPARMLHIRTVHTPVMLIEVGSTNKSKSISECCVYSALPVWMNSWDV